MPRPLRVEFPEALYHVTTRGVRQEAVVLDDHDRIRWTDYLKEAVRRFGLELYAFALMDNHFHLFARAPLANLGKAMQYLNGAYAMYFNKRHERSGHLFEKRYHAVLIESQGHYTEVSRYIHLNPVRAGAADRPEQYAWSSYPGYHFGRMPLPWLNYGRVLAEFGEGKEARARYRDFVAHGIGKKLPPPWANAIGGWLLGSPRFTAKIYALLAKDAKDSRWDSRAVAAKPAINATIDKIVRAVCDEFHVTPEELKTGTAKSRMARQAFVLTARDRAGYSWKSVGLPLDAKTHGATLYLGGQARMKMGRDENFRKHIARMESRLKS
jgi:REP element-mobilizing transposase RayT